MIKRLFPTQMIDSIYELPIHKLKDIGIKGIIFDIDNTLVPYDVPTPTKEIIAFFEQLKSEGIHVTLVSNNTEERVTRFNKDLKLVAIHKAQKPLKKNLRRIVQELGCKPQEVVLVGDQIFTDVYGGNRMGMKTFLVKPISDKDEWQVKIKRKLEKYIIKGYNKHLMKLNEK